MKKYKNKYRTKSIRLENWDYRNNGAYFITICTANRKHFFGEIPDKTMQLNEIGKLAEKYWQEIPDHFPFVELGNFVIMPNHTHGVLIIDNAESLQCKDSTINDDSTNDDSQKNKNEQMSKISPKAGSISTIIRSYKSVVTKNARQIQADFGWQSRFHDHIIRNYESFVRIQNYIKNNPSNWNKDKLHA